MCLLRKDFYSYPFAGKCSRIQVLIIVALKTSFEMSFIYSAINRLLNHTIKLKTRGKKSQLHGTQTGNMFPGIECIKGNLASPNSPGQSGLYHVLWVNYLFCKLGPSVLLHLTVKAFLRARETLLF